MSKEGRKAEEEHIPSDESVETEEDEASQIPQEEDSDDELSSLKAKVEELEEARLRMAAETQNTRKRLVKQQQDAYKYRHQDILRDLTDVIDNFNRAIDSAGESRNFESFYEGILMIEKQFTGMLEERYGLEQFGSEDEEFDPAAHEAVMMEESSDVEVEKIKEVFQAGYRLQDRVLRPAKVVVLKPVQAETEENAESDGEPEEELS